MKRLPYRAWARIGVNYQWPRREQMIAWFLACTSSTPADDPGADDTALAWPEVPVESVPGLSDEADWIFTHRRVHDVDIRLSDQAIASLWEDRSVHVEGDLAFDNEVISSVGVRLKGRIGSFRELSGKSSFKIDLNRFVADQRFYGLESLTLNNAVVDCSYSKEHLAYRVIREAGLPGSRAGYAWVTVNDEPYGLYVLVETQDDRFLTRTFEDPGGPLYDGKYLWDWRTETYTLLDLETDLAPLFQQEEGPDVEHADLLGLTTTLDEVEGDSDFYERMGEVVDWDRQHRAVAVDQWVGHLDGYSMNTNNYRVYFDPGAGGRAVIVPWDLDYGFLKASWWGMNWRTPRGRLTEACWDDEACSEAQGVAVQWLLDEVIDEQAYEEMVEEIHETIDAYVDEDPRRECSTSEVRSTRADLLDWIEERDRNLENFWDL